MNSNQHPRKICVVTGTRAEYGLLAPLLKLLVEDAQFELFLVATGTHLSADYGNTYQEIVNDGFLIHHKVEMLLASDTSSAIAKSMGLGVIGFADYFDKHPPDLLIVLGDRFEILSAVQAAMIARVPVLHLCGGDSTEGAFDESIRHSISKMAHVHCVTNLDSQKRVIHLGEDPKNVHCTGHLGLDNIRNMKKLSKDEIEKKISFKFRKKNLLITYHPETLATLSVDVQISQLLKALDRLDAVDTGLIFTLPNSDTGGRYLSEKIEAFVSARPNTISFKSLGQFLYLNTMNQVDAVVGNSSSGLLEAPSFNIPTVNIGDRQKGRILAESVMQCECEDAHIFSTIQKALMYSAGNVSNPFGDGQAAQKIIAVIKGLSQAHQLVKKKFFDVKLA